MLSVKGIFTKGMARPLDPLEGHEGQAVIITFLEQEPLQEYPNGEGTAWSALTSLIQECAVETGIDDLAHQHDHYLYDTPKQAGFTTAELLDKMMSGRKPEKQKILIEPDCIMPRQSTDIIAVEDPNVSTAVRYIRENADRNISVRDVVNATMLARTRLYEHFCSILGHSISAEIRRVRINRVKELLRVFPGQEIRAYALIRFRHNPRDRLRLDILLAERAQEQGEAAVFVLVTVGKRNLHESGIMSTNPVFQCWDAAGKLRTHGAAMKTLVEADNNVFFKATVSQSPCFCEFHRAFG